jgi:NAD+ diphosphatase
MTPMQASNIMAGPYLDRAAHLRQDPAWFANALTGAASRVVPLWNLRSLVADPSRGDPSRGDPSPGNDSTRAAYLALTDLPADRRTEAHLILLGTFHGNPMFACEFDSPDPPQIPPGTRFEDLRMVAANLPADEAALLGYARAMLLWRQRSRFCGICGSPTVAAKAGHVLVCTNPACRHEQFPRLDPAIIVLVSDGERALLGRQASWPAGRYSTIAGFVEPGESLEDAVAREVFEETGIEVADIKYHSSQPWPFPSSLMLGFTARATTTQIQLRDDELEDARWFTRAEFAEKKTIAPPGVSISFRLIEHWFNAGSDQKLRDIHGASSWTSSR